VRSRLHFAGPHIDDFRRWLSHRGYRETTIVERVRLLAHWTDWAHKAGFTLATAPTGLDASGPVFAGSRTGEEVRRSGALFIRYMQDQGLAPGCRQSGVPAEVRPVLAAFRDWMRSHRGIASSSLDTYQTILVDLLEALGDDPKAYTAQAIRRFVLERARPHGLARAKSIANATRAFLRFLVATGQCPSGRDHAVPGFASWQLTSVPACLGPKDIERVLAACEGDSRLRDRAIILLLARLGLRAGEAAGLALGDIDWKEGRLAVAGKSRRQEWLPLTQEVGDALIAYLERARPPVATLRLFITSTAPLRPITPGAVKGIVRRALIAAGVESAHQGAHVLRHAAAAAMLRHGVSLAGIGAVLRHRSLTMTMHYAKVDFALLAEIAQPWAARSAC
jgi:site-specific recombinase XerD